MYRFVVLRGKMIVSYVIIKCLNICLYKWGFNNKDDIFLMIIVILCLYGKNVRYFLFLWIMS